MNVFQTQSGLRFILRQRFGSSDRHNSLKNTQNSFNQTEFLCKALCSVSTPEPAQLYVACGTNLTKEQRMHILKGHAKEILYNMYINTVSKRLNQNFLQRYSGQATRYLLKMKVTSPGRATRWRSRETVTTRRRWTASRTPEHRQRRT